MADINDVIDRVAAESTRGELSPEFHARVMARIETRRAPYMTWGLAAAAAAAVVLAIVVAHPWQRPPAPSQPTVAATSPAIEPVTTPLAPPTSPASIDTPIKVSRPRAVGQAPIFTPQLAALPPIEPIEPITRESIQPTRLAIPQLTLEPIVVPAVDDDGSIRERR